jgi:hypothetical protein
MSKKMKKASINLITRETNFGKIQVYKTLKRRAEINRSSG